MGMLTNVFKDLTKEIVKGTTNAAIAGAKTAKEGFIEGWNEGMEKNKHEIDKNLAEIKQNCKEIKNNISKKKNKSDKDNNKFNFNF